MPPEPSLLNAVLEKADQLLNRLTATHPAPLEFCPDDVHTLRWNCTQGAQSVNWKCNIQRKDLLHVDQQAELLFQNTQQFVSGLPANNVLLWGSRGTGKSSLLQSALSFFVAQGLRAIEMNRNDFADWPRMVEWIRLQTGKFIIYCDDLSFDADDASYRQVKAALEGSLSQIPDNALVYATSNRRHLLPERLADNSRARHIDGEIHHHEAVEEAISLSDRFGLWLSFHPLTQDQYLDIVRHWLIHFGIDYSQTTYREEALRWALQRGSRSGRIANQFARHYAGSVLLKERN